MGEWKKTSCTLCACTCGLEVLVEDNKIVRVLGDKDNPKTEGYVCRKGRGMQYLQHQKDRNRYPMKKLESGEFVRISWDQAITEICEKLKLIVDKNGPKAFACQGLGGFYGGLHTVMAKMFMGALGSQWHYRALAAELTGVFWSHGSIMGNQAYGLSPDEEDGEVLVVSGWNPYVSHQMVKGKEVVKEYATNPDKCLIVMDPRRSETARMADIHLAIRPGTDALLWRAMCALLIQQNWHDKEYIARYVSDFDKVLPWFEGIDVKQYCEFCELDYDDVYRVTKILSTRKFGLHADLGVICGRHSTLATHLQHVFIALCGQLLKRGGQVLSQSILSLPHTDVDDPKFWRTPVTDFPQITGLYPTAVLGEEINNDHPDRIRALFCVNSNPIHSLVDTKLQAEALGKLELLVTIDCAFTETARMSDYVLPNTTGFECFELPGFAMTTPDVFAQMRQPVLEREGELEDGVDIWLKMFDGMGYLPTIPESLYEAAKGDRGKYMAELGGYMAANPEAEKFKAVIMIKTLGRAMGSTSIATLWFMLQMTSKDFRESCARRGFAEGPMQMEEVFAAVMSHPEGVMIGKMDFDDLFKLLQTPDKKLHLFAKELDEWVYEITPELEGKAMSNKEFPMVLNAGTHIEANINHTMRDPAWIKGLPNPLVVSINPKDAQRLGIEDKQVVKVITAIGEVEVPAKITPYTRPGSVIIPHGFGFVVEGKKIGFSVNMITSNKNRDRFAGTPFIRYEPCRVEVIAGGVSV